MASLSRSILVIGATGLIGRFLVESLIEAQDSFDKIAIFTSLETLANKKSLVESFQSRGVGVITGNLSCEDDVLNAYEGFDTVVSALGRAAIDKQIDLIALAERSPNVVRFIPSEFGTDIAYDTSSVTEAPHQKKLRIRAFLESEAVHRLTYTYIVTGPFADLFVAPMASEPQAGSFNVAKKEATLLGGGKGRVGLTTMTDVGRLLVGVLKHPDACDGKAIKVNSFFTTPDEILHEFERQTGEKWTVHYTPLNELRRLEADAWKKENPLATAYTLRRIWAEGKTLYDEMDNLAIKVTNMDTLGKVVKEAISKEHSL